MANPTVAARLSARETPERTAVLPPAFKARMWQPGQSGNPQGKSGRFQEVQRICREASPEAARKLVELMSDDDPRIAGWASDKVLERAWGKPKEYDPREETPETLSIDPSQFTPAQRVMIRRMLRLLLSATPTEDATSMAAGALLKP